MKSCVQLLALVSALLFCESLAFAGDFVWTRTILDNWTTAGGSSYLLYDSDEDEYSTEDQDATNSITEASVSGRSRSNSAGHTVATEEAEIAVNPDGQARCQVLSLLHATGRVQRDEYYAIAYVDHGAGREINTSWELTRINGSAPSTTVSVKIELVWDHVHLRKSNSTFAGVDINLDITGLGQPVEIYVNSNNKIVVYFDDGDTPTYWVSNNTIEEGDSLVAEFDVELNNEAVINVNGLIGVGAWQYNQTVGQESVTESAFSIDISFEAQ